MKKRKSQGTRPETPKNLAEGQAAPEVDLDEPVLQGSKTAAAAAQNAKRGEQDADERWPIAKWMRLEWEDGEGDMLYKHVVSQLQRRRWCDSSEYEWASGASGQVEGALVNFMDVLASRSGGKRKRKRKRTDADAAQPLLTWRDVLDILSESTRVDSEDQQKALGAARARCHSRFGKQR